MKKGASEEGRGMDFGQGPKAGKSIAKLDALAEYLCLIDQDASFGRLKIREHHPA